MRRRRFLAGLTGVAAGGASAIGTGAFSSLSADRTVTVKVEDDDDAYLTLDPSSDLSRATTASDKLEFYIPGLKTRAGLSDTPTGNGIAPNSSYTFANLLSVQNRGGDRVEVYSDTTGLPAGVETLSLTDSGRQTILDGRDVATEIAPGGRFQAGLFVETGDSDLGSYELSMSIIATQPK